MTYDTEIIYFEYVDRKDIMEGTAEYTGVKIWHVIYGEVRNKVMNSVLRNLQDVFRDHL